MLAGKVAVGTKVCLTRSIAVKPPFSFRPALAAKRMSGVAASMPEGGLAAFHPLRTFELTHYRQSRSPGGPSRYRNPMDSHGTAATITSATTRAKIYGQIRHSASSGEILPIAQAP